MSSEPAPLTGAYRTLLEQVVEYVYGEMQHIPEDAIGDSPIEKVLFAALVALTRFADSEYQRVEVPSEQRPLAVILQSPTLTTLVVEPQAQLEGWRVDFLVHAWELGRISGRPQWRRLIVECDGHEFHERTKAQAERDRGRDREWQLRGYTVLRFPGSKIHADPLGCARQISEWGALGW